MTEQRLMSVRGILTELYDEVGHIPRNNFTTTMSKRGVYPVKKDVDKSYSRHKKILFYDVDEVLEALKKKPYKPVRKMKLDHMDVITVNKAGVLPKIVKSFIKKHGIKPITVSGVYGGNVYSQKQLLDLGLLEYEKEYLAMMAEEDMRLPPPRKIDCINYKECIDGEALHGKKMGCKTCERYQFDPDYRFK